MLTILVILGYLIGIFGTLVFLKATDWGGSPADRGLVSVYWIIAIPVMFLVYGIILICKFIDQATTDIADRFKEKQE